MAYSGKSSWRICGGIRGRVDLTRLFSSRDRASLKGMAMLRSDSGRNEVRMIRYARANLVTSYILGVFCDMVEYLVCIVWPTDHLGRSIRSNVRSDSSNVLGTHGCCGWSISETRGRDS